MSMRIACVGGGPGGLFLATLIKASQPETQVTLFERNRADDTFGFGVVFSDATLAGIHAADPVLRNALEEHGVHWDRIEGRLKDERWGCSGNGMTAIVRKTLLQLLRARAQHTGVDIRFETDVGLDDVEGYDLVVAADGANSRLRERLADLFQPSFVTGLGEVHLVRHDLPVRRADVRARARAGRRVRRARLSHRRRAEHLHRRDRRRDVAEGRA